MPSTSAVYLAPPARCPCLGCPLRSYCLESAVSKQRDLQRIRRLTRALRSPRGEHRGVDERAAELTSRSTANATSLTWSASRTDPRLRRPLPGRPCTRRTPCRRPPANPCPSASGPHAHRRCPRLRRRDPYTLQKKSTSDAYSRARATRRRRTLPTGIRDPHGCWPA